MAKSLLLVTALAGAASAVSDGNNDSSICVSSSGSYTMRVNLFASELGYYTFDECPGLTNPTIGMEIGETYTFNQADRTNYFHPLGFAYFADGAHDGQDELEPGIAPYGTDTTCADNLSCPSPRYYLNGEYLGGNQESGNFGLDDYEPLFFHPLPEWTAYGEFEVKLKFDNEGFVGDIFYFCHIHQFMSGRIKLLKSGVPVQEANKPILPYMYDKPGSFDQKCGSYGLDPFQLPNKECYEKFVCNAPTDGSPLAQFSTCIDAMNCHMMAGMTTGVSANEDSLTALFVHQMVPHHQNAVNMAKSLLKTGMVQCADLTSNNPICVMESIAREIINGQNAQIQTMYGIVSALGYPRKNDCKVLVSSGEGTKYENEYELGNDKEGSKDYYGSGSSSGGGYGSGSSEYGPGHNSKGQVCKRKCSSGRKLPFMEPLF